MAETLDGLNCTSSGEVDAVGDIVGPGILAAFFATASITILVVIIAYFLDILEEDLLGELDYYFIGQTRELLGGIRTWLRTKLFRVKSDPAASNVVNVEQLASIDASRDTRKDAIIHFILALSDQQLVTGLAVLVAGVTGQRHISGYEFSVVLSLAWFSSTTHLATIDVLRKQLSSYRVTSTMRVIGMLFVLCFLTYAFGLNLKTAFYFVDVPVQCGLNSPFPPRDPLGLFAFIFALILIWTGYLVRLQGLYFGERRVSFFGSRIALAIPFWGTSSNRESSHAEFFEQAQATRRIDKIRRLQRALARSEGNFSLESAFLRLSIASYKYNDSFLCTIPSVGFSFAYGVAQVIVYRWQAAPNLSPTSSEMGFGQIVSLFLLVLPCLSAGDAYFAYRNPPQSRPKQYNGTARHWEAAFSGHEKQAMVSDCYALASEPLSATGIEYKREYKYLKKYFPCRMQGPDLSDSRKASIMEDYRILKSTENAVRVAVPLSLFFADFVFSVTIGVLINTKGAQAMIRTIGCSFFLLKVAYEFVGNLSEIAYLVKYSGGECHDLVDQASPTLFPQEMTHRIREEYTEILADGSKKAVRQMVTPEVSDMGGSNYQAEKTAHYLRRHRSI